MLGHPQVENPDTVHTHKQHCIRYQLRGKSEDRKGDYSDFDNPNPNPLIFIKQGNVIPISNQNLSMNGLHTLNKGQINISYHYIHLNLNASIQETFLSLSFNRREACQNQYQHLVCVA